MEGLRGHLSGLGIPTYVIDSPHGGGKIPIMPNYLVSASDDAVVLRNYEGMLVRYQAEDRPNTAQPTASRGVSALLQGSKSVLVPENSERMARRRQLNVISDVSEGENGCASSCSSDEAHEPAGPKFPLNVLANGCGS
jgi:lysine 2,3-aminomutase